MMKIKPIIWFVVILSATLGILSFNHSNKVNGSNIDVPELSSSMLFLVNNEKLNPRFYSNLCVNPIDIPDEELHWTYIPQNASELNTYIDYYFLAGQLIKSGAIDASTCPTGGMTSSDYPNACGMSKAQDLVYEIQNAYDDDILLAWDVVGIPPVLLKQLIRIESQFWPGRWGLYHWGLGHITYNGAHTGLMWNNILYKEICDYTYGGDCDYRIDETMIYALLGLLDAECPTCENKIDMPKAKRSVYYIAQTLLGHCYQSSQIIANVTSRSANDVVDYTTIWKMTLYNYNAGPVCLYNSIESAYENLPESERDTALFDWDTIKKYPIDSHCLRGINYADQITAKFYRFPPNK